LPTNDFKYFATTGSPNVVDQATYAASTYVGPGRSSGILPSNVYNKIARQGAAGAAMLGQLINNQLGVDALDNGDLTTLVANLTLAIQQSAIILPARTVTSSATLNLTLADFAVGLNRTAGLAPQLVNLPNGATVGQRFQLSDLVGNFNAYPLTVAPPAGSIAGENNWVLNEDRGGAEFTYFGSNLWGVKTW